MAVARGTIAITTGAVGTTFTVSGLSFAPTAIFFNWSGKSTAGVAEQDHRWGSGIATGTASRRAYATQSDHAIGTSASDCHWRNDCCVAVLTTAGAINGRADINAMNSDGFQLIIDAVFSAAMDVQWMAWDATNVQIVDHTTPAGTGNQDIATSFSLATGSIDDKALIVIGGVLAAVNTSAAYSTQSIGVVAGHTPVNAVLCGAASDAAANMVTCCYCRTGDCLGEASDDAIVYRASVTGWDQSGNGFRLNYTTAAANRRFSILVMKGGNLWQVGDSVTSTGGTNQVENTTYEPTGLLIGSHGRAQSTAGTTQAEQEFIIGLATGASARSSMSLRDDDAPTTSDIACAFHTDNMYYNIAASTAAADGIMDLVSFDATPSFTFVMDDADPTAMYFFYLLTADADTGVTLTPSAASAAYSISAPSLVKGGITRTPSAVSAAYSIAAPTVIKGALVKTPTPVAAVYSIGAPTLSSAKVIIPTAVAATLGIATPNVVKGGIVILPASITASYAIAAPNLIANITLLPTAVVGVYSIMAPVVVNTGGAAPGDGGKLVIYTKVGTVSVIA